jgi:AcrR family transcriptional regulator
MHGAAATLDRESVSERIRRAAIVLFKARGYHGTPVRALARAVRLEAASLYYHFPSKQEILSDIFDRVMDDLLDGLQRAAEGETNPEDRVRAAVRFHVLFHIERRDEACIRHSELRSLTGPNLRRIIAKRDRYEAMFRAVLAAGIKAGAFEAHGKRLMTIAILTMCSGVADWVCRQGRLGAVADAYARMVLRLLRGSTDPQPAHVSTARRRLPTCGSPRARGRGGPQPILVPRPTGS